MKTFAKIAISVLAIFLAIYCAIDVKNRYYPKFTYVSEVESSGLRCVAWIYKRPFKRWGQRKFGYVRHGKKRPEKFCYDGADDYYNGLAKVSLYTESLIKGKYGYVNTEGKPVVPIEFDEVGDWVEGMVKVKKGSRYGFYNKLGELIVPIKYDDVEDYHNGFAAVRINQKKGLINKNGKEIIPISYDFVGEFSEGYAAVGISTESGSKYGYINESGQLVIPMKFSTASKFKEGLAHVHIGGGHWNNFFDIYEYDDPLQGYINTTGDFVIDRQFTEATDFHKGIAIAKKGCYVIINKSGQVLKELDYDECTGFSDDGLARVTYNVGYDKEYHHYYKNGYINMNGDIAIPIVFEYADKFSEGMAWVQSDKKSGDFECIDINGDIKFRLRERDYPFSGIAYTGNTGYNNSPGNSCFFVKPFVNGKAEIKNGYNTFYIDKQGNRIYGHIGPFQYEKINHKIR